jgi:23S rRNA (cytosine1962-C5)-methyltransferase
MDAATKLQAQSEVSIILSFMKENESDQKNPVSFGKRLPRVRLRIRRNTTHPWIYRKMVGDIQGRVEPGELTEVYDKDRRFVGYAFCNPESEITLRLLAARRRGPPDAKWFQTMIGRAAALRHDVLRLPAHTDAYRLIHSEGDGLSGLVVDRYAEVLVAQIYSAGMKRALPQIKESLRTYFPEAEILVRADARSEKREGVSLGEDPAERRPKKVVIREGNLRFHVDPTEGHKTGFFLDQRDNRAFMAELVRDAGGIGSVKALDCFCYTGGFGISMAAAGAKQLECIDLDEEALKTAEQNRKLNQLTEAPRFVHADVFNVLRERQNAEPSYSHIVLDPAKAALVRDEIPRAQRAYGDMNRMAMKLLRPGGILLSCSCSGLIGETDFIDLLRGAAAEARVEMQILRVAGAPPDHPWAVRVPEGRYLKAVFSRIWPLP